MKTINKLLLFSFLLFTSLVYAKTGLLFNILESGSPVSADIILCLNGKGPMSCQNYHVSAQNLTIRSTANHNYPIAGIKVLTSGISASGCTPYNNGYCLFATNSTTGAGVVLNSSGQNKAVPGAPTGVTASIGNTSSLVQWTAPANAGSSPILSYTATASNGNSCTITVPSTECRVTGLTNGTSYTFTVTATNAVGTSIPSAVSNAVIPTLIQVLANFDSTTGYFDASGVPYAWGALIEGSDGNLYGIAPNGGASSQGTLFRLSLADNSLAVLANFDSSTGAKPYGKLLQASDGNFYGEASEGGDNNLGTIYRYSPSDATLSALASFSNPVGSFPIGGLIQAADGSFYGSTTAGGQNSAGTVFKFSLSGNLISLVADMDNATGLSPRAVIQALDGNLYGTATLGGTNGAGTIFKVSLPSNTINALASFDPSVGINPYAGLMQANDGNLYGVPLAGGTGGVGTVYRASPTGSSIEVVSALQIATTGGLSRATLVQASDGFLYGTTPLGGANGEGSVFQSDPVSGALNVVVSLDAATTGGSPYGGLLLASNGNLYGMTTTGASGSLGTLFVVYPPFT